MTPHEIRLKCLETQDPITAVNVEWGWSKEEGAVCVYASAVNRYAGGDSEVVVKGYPMDCIPAPEPIGALASGLVLLAVLARSRSRRR